MVAMKALTVTLIVATLVQAALSGPVPTTSQASEVPKTVDEMLEMYINDYYFVYDYRVEAMDVEIQKLLQYITEATPQIINDSEMTSKYNHIKRTLIHFQAKMHQFHDVVGIYDVLMLMGGSVTHKLITIDDEELVQKSQVLVDLLKMDESEKQAQAMRKLIAFLKASDESVNKEYNDKFKKWSKENFSAVSIWD